jgi:glucokinase
MNQKALLQIFFTLLLTSFLPVGDLSALALSSAFNPSSTISHHDMEQLKIPFLQKTPSSSMVKSMNYAIGVDLGGTQIKAAIVNDKGAIFSFQLIPTEADQGAQHVLGNILKVVSELISQAKSQDITITAIGVGTPGVVDQKKGGVISGCPQMPDWVGVPFINSLESKFSLPVYAHNDVTMMTYGEHAFGAAVDHANAICITLGTGVGGGIVIENQIYDGASNYAGEVGHAPINFDGPKCSCGSTGCWETYVSATALVKSAKKAGLQIDNTEMIFKKAQEGDPLAKKLINDYIFYLGVGIAGLINIFNPDVFVIGGGVAQAGEALFKPLREVVKNRAMAYANDHAQILPAKLGEQAGLIGAAQFALSERLASLQLLNKST